MKPKLFTNVLFALVAACDNGIAVPLVLPAPKVLVTTDRSDEFETKLSHIGTERQPTASTIVKGHLESATLFHDSATILLGVVHPDARRELVAVDVRSLGELWRRTISLRLVPTETKDIGLRTAGAVAESTDGRWLYISQATCGGNIGIARVDRATLVVAACDVAWNVAPGLVRTLPATTGLPTGAVAMVASRQNPGGGPLRAVGIYFLDPLTLAPFDSLTSVSLGEPGAVINLLVLEGGRSLLIGTESRVLRYDLITRRVSATAVRRGLGAVVALGAGGGFALLDQGRFPELPGSGRVYLLASDLTLTDSIDVSTPLGGTPESETATVMGGGAFDAESGELYVRTGSAPFGAIYPAQPARTLVLNIRERRVSRVVTMPGSNFGLVFRTPER